MFPNFSTSYFGNMRRVGVELYGEFRIVSETIPNLPNVINGQEGIFDRISTYVRSMLYGILCIFFMCTNGQMKRVNAAGISAHMASYFTNFRYFAARKYQRHNVHASSLAIPENLTVSARIGAEGMQNAFSYSVVKTLSYCINKPRKSNVNFGTTSLRVTMHVFTPIMAVTKTFLMHWFITAKYRARLHGLNSFSLFVITGATQALGEMRFIAARVFTCIDHRGIPLGLPRVVTSS